MPTPEDAAPLSRLIRTRRSVRDFLPTAIPAELLDAILSDANASPSWSNTQPYRIAVASGALRDRLAAELCGLFDRGMAAQKGGTLARLKRLLTRQGLPDGDFATQFAYPSDLQPRRRDTGRGLYELLGIGRHDLAARDRQMRRNFEFFGAPTAIFLFAHKGLREFSVLDTGVYLQTLMLSAQARGLAVPGDIAIVGFGDVPFVSDMVPALTTVRINGAEIGERAARCLMARAEGQTVEPRTVDVGFSIIERDSA